MTVEHLEPYVEFTCTGASIYAFEFPVEYENELLVLRTVSGVESTLVYNTDYYVDLEPDGTGEITTVVAYSTGQISIQRNMPLDQQTSWVNGEDFDVTLLEHDIDLIVWKLQQLQYGITQAAITTWGDITGDITDQVDLQAALAAIVAGEGGGTWGTIIGTLSDQTDLQAALDAITASIPSEGIDLDLGEPTDTSLTDGLLPWTTGTKVTDALDDLNEVMSALAPPPAPDLDDIDLNTTSGYDGKIALSAYTVTGIGSLPAVGVDELFDETGNRAGVINGTTSITGTLNEDVPEGTGSPFVPYPANSFGNGDQGTLVLELNGTEIHSVDLASAGAGDDVNANGSGFNLSAATAVKFPGGSDFPQFKYRTGTWTLHYNDMIAGWNYIRVKHTVGAVTTTTDYADCLRDTNTTATTFSSVSLDTPNGGSAWYLSGVQYWGSFTATLRGTVSNLYKDTYWGGSAIFANNVTGNWSWNNETLPACSGDTNQQVTVGIVITANNYNRFIGTDLSGRLGAYRTVQSTVYSATQTMQDVLIDRSSTGSTDETNYDSFDRETYRMQHGSTWTSTTFSSNWTESESLVGADAGHNNGLQVAEGYLQYPYGNWAYTNAPGSNPNYTSASGVRYYYRYFKDVTYATGNMNIYFTGSGTFISEGTSFSSANQLKCSIRLPTQTDWMDTYEDFVTDQWGAGDGCRTAGNGRAMYTAWSLTVGTKSTANSGNGVYVRITVPDGGTAWLSSMSFGWSN